MNEGMIKAIEELPGIEWLLASLASDGYSDCSGWFHFWRAPPCSWQQTLPPHLRIMTLQRVVMNILFGKPFPLPSSRLWQETSRKINGKAGLSKSKPCWKELTSTVPTSETWRREVDPAVKEKTIWFHGKSHFRWENQKRWFGMTFCLTLLSCQWALPASFGLVWVKILTQKDLDALGQSSVVGPADRAWKID